MVATMLMLDAGLREGEAAALTWGQVRWGADENDTQRALVIDRNRPRGGAETTPKSGRTRIVALSRRLREALRLLFELEFEPGPDGRVLPDWDPPTSAGGRGGGSSSGQPSGTAPRRI